MATGTTLKRDRFDASPSGIDAPGARATPRTIAVDGTTPGASHAPSSIRAAPNEILPDGSGRLGLNSLVRCVDGGKTLHDDNIDHNLVPIDIVPAPTAAEGELEHALFSNAAALSPQHLATHLPKIPGCSGCDMGKAAKSPSRRRMQPFTQVKAPEVESEPFGALVHMDHIEMDRCSEAAATARYALNIHTNVLVSFDRIPCTDATRTTSQPVFTNWTARHQGFDDDGRIPLENLASQYDLSAHNDPWPTRQRHIDHKRTGARSA